MFSILTLWERVFDVKAFFSFLEGFFSERMPYPMQEFHLNFETPKRNSIGAHSLRFHFSASWTKSKPYFGIPVRHLDAFHTRVERKGGLLPFSQISQQSAFGHLANPCYVPFVGLTSICVGAQFLMDRLLREAKFPLCFSPFLHP